VFAVGCFWGVQGVFQHTKGVLNAVSGYLRRGNEGDGNLHDGRPSGMTGNARQWRDPYDPRQASYGQLMQRLLFRVMTRNPWEPPGAHSASLKSP